MIGAVLLRFNGDRVLLHQAVASIVGSLESNSNKAVSLGDVVLVDNASTVDPHAVDRITAAFDQRNDSGQRVVRVIRRKSNDGFATGVNAGIAALHPACTTVLLLNDDAVLDAKALALLRNALDQAPRSVVSVAPKMYLHGQNGLLDSVGMAVNRFGEAKNIGLGQLDLGQFDGQAAGKLGAYDIFGPCFGAAMFRRSAFAADGVGPLREDYFMYYEDVEWNWRAQRMGLRSLAIPSAHVWHHMSASSRVDVVDNSAATVSTVDMERSYGNKHRCIERNLLGTGGSLLGRRDALHLWTYRWPRLVKAGLTGRFPRASSLAAMDAIRALPTTIARRRHIAQVSTTTADQPLTYWPSEPIFFDPVTYQPECSWNALTTSARRAGYSHLAEACTIQDIPAALMAASSLPDPVHAERAMAYLSRLASRCAATTDQT